MPLVAMSTNGFPGPDARGYVYLVHFSGRTKQGRQHYLGFSSNLERRYGQHRFGWGANETKKAIAEGLKLTVAQTWKGTPTLERRLKEWSREEKKGFSGICPLCPREDDLPPDLARELGKPSMRIYHSAPAAA
jgi:predicted GIY-YIG superfamily endonuclease